MPTRPQSPSFSGIEDLPASPLRSTEPSTKKKKKSSVRKFSAKSRASSTSKLSAAGLARRLDKDLGSASGSGPGPASPIRCSPVLHSPASTARKGRRVRDSGVSVAVRAERRAAARDLPPSGSSAQPSLPASPVRLVLPALSDDHLLHIMSDIGVAAIPGMGSPSHLLSVIRANEAAQAAIAKAVEAAKGAGPAGAQGQAGGLEATNGCGQSSAPRSLLRWGVPSDLSLVGLRADRVSVLKTFPANESSILEYSWFRC